MVVLYDDDIKVTVIFTPEEIKDIITFAKEDTKDIPEFVRWLIETGVKIYQLTLEKKG